MKILYDLPVQGFCGGVSRAIAQAEKAAAANCEQPVTILGSLVHNRFVNDSLQKRGLQILEAKNKTRLELLDEIESGTVIFTAHGVSDAVRKKAGDKGLQVIDASCPFVLSTQKLIAQKRKEGYSILYCGKKGHPEAEGAVGSQENIWLIETEADLPNGLAGPIFVTNQTTLSVLELQDLFDAILKKYPQAEICNEICSATRVRQKAVLDLKDQGFDLLIVVGDPASNNTAKLAQAGKSAGIPSVILLESADALQKEKERIRKASAIAVTSGASTPSYLKDEVLAMVQTIDPAFSKTDRLPKACPENPSQAVRQNKEGSRQ